MFQLKHIRLQATHKLDLYKTFQFYTKTFNLESQDRRSHTLSDKSMKTEGTSILKRVAVITSVNLKINSHIIKIKDKFVE